MPLIVPSHIVSFSSEDPCHPASNLLNGETYRKWKCKEPGEKEGFAVFKFDKAVAFTGIDIGNDGSALVEVRVARSGTGTEGTSPEFEVLLSSSVFMSPLESREGKNLNGVRNFTVNTLSKPIAAQKWDLAKVVVSQPFNKHVQYGLTFIKFVAAPDPNEAPKIGGFALRAPVGGDDSDDDDLKPGSLFSKVLKSPKKDLGSMATTVSALQLPTNSNRSSISTHAEIMETSAKLSNASKLSNDTEVKSLLQKSKTNMPSPSGNKPKGSVASKNQSDDDLPLPNRKQLPDPRLKSKDDKSSTSKVQSPQQLNKSPVSTKSKDSANKSNKPSQKRGLSPDPPSGNSPTPSTSGGVSTKKKKAKKTKPFNKLFEGVVFSMSGYQNPIRGQIRDKAVQMGAKYRNDWDRNCTHLICAFFGTPKFRDVRSSGHGEIVKERWIQQSHADRCRYPWRRYCLDRNDKGTESEEEIFAESDSGDSNGDVMEEEEKDSDEIRTKKRKRVLVMDSSDEHEDSNDNDSNKAYAVDTDVDEDEDVTPDLSPSLLSSGTNTSSFFKDSHFCLIKTGSQNSNTEIAKLEQIIAKHKGKIEKTPTDSTDYVICPSLQWDDDFTDILSDNPNITFVHENWILECEKEDALVDAQSFILTPS